MLVPINCGRSGVLSNGCLSAILSELRGRFSSGLPAPEVTLGVQRKLTAEIALTITGATFSRQEPRPSTRCPTIWRGRSEPRVLQKSDEFVTLDIDLAEARYLEGDREAGRFGPEQTATGKQRTETSERGNGDPDRATQDR